MSALWLKYLLGERMAYLTHCTTKMNSPPNISNTQFCTLFKSLNKVLVYTWLNVPLVEYSNYLLYALFMWLFTRKPVITLFEWITVVSALIEYLFTTSTYTKHNGWHLSQNVLQALAALLHCRSQQRHHVGDIHCLFCLSYKV